MAADLVADLAAAGNEGAGVAWGDFAGFLGDFGSSAVSDFLLRSGPAFDSRGFVCSDELVEPSDVVRFGGTADLAEFRFVEFSEIPNLLGSIGGPVRAASLGGEPIFCLASEDFLELVSVFNIGVVRRLGGSGFVPVL